MLESRPKLDIRKRKMKRVIERFISTHCTEKKVAVLLSGGTDSTTIALAAHHLGKKVAAFSFEVAGYPNPDCEQARKTCAVMGWDFERVEVGIGNLQERFLDLFFEYGCAKKTEAECLFPMLDVVQRVRAMGYKNVLTGFGSPIPDDRSSTIRCKANPTEYWDSNYELVGFGDTSATHKIIQVAASKGVRVLMPLLQKGIIDALYGLSPSEMMGRPYEKHHWKDLYYQDFVSLGLLDQSPWGDLGQRHGSPGLQVGGQIEKVFAKLLADADLNPCIDENRVHKGDAKRQIISLCQYWAKQVARHASRPSMVKSQRRTSCAKYVPYRLRDVIAASKRAHFTVVSTFAGGGGSSTGYKLAGGKVIFANEFIPAAMATYTLNYPDTPVVPFDLRQINRSKESVEKLFAKYGVKKGTLDIFDGSPPCATFSRASAGKGKDKLTKKNVAYSDTTQSRIGMLIHDYVFMANVMQPKVCVMENVPDIANSEVFQHALARLRRWGYLVNFKRLNAADYHVPQARKRLFLIAIRPDIAEAASITSESDILAVFPEPKRGVVTLRSGLVGITVDKHERDRLLSRTRLSSNYELLKQLPLDPPRPMNPSRIGWKSDFNLVRAAWKTPCPTITQTGGKRNGVIHPLENRTFTIAELKRITALPDDFQLSGTWEQKAERIGRMVPPLMTKAVAAAVYAKVLKPAKRS